jgi:hypothetical protein
VAQPSIVVPALCPAGYVSVPPLSPYTSSAFCVGKYIASGSLGSPGVSVAGAIPWISITRNNAIAACLANNRNGASNYDLISNAEWQAVARNIEGVPGNWSEGRVGSPGGLNRGPSDRVGDSALIPSTNDTEACSGTTVVATECSDSIWHRQRRTFTLNNGDPTNHIVWDVAGNVAQWVKDDGEPLPLCSVYELQYAEFANTTYRLSPNVMNGYIQQISHTPCAFLTSAAYAAFHTIANEAFYTIGNVSGTFRTHIAPAGDYTADDYTSSRGGLGFAWLIDPLADITHQGAIFRGGLIEGDKTGVFAVSLRFNSTTSTDPALGFRCVYHP